MTNNRHASATAIGAVLAGCMALSAYVYYQTNHAEGSEDVSIFDWIGTFFNPQGTPKKEDTAKTSAVPPDEMTAEEVIAVLKHILSIQRSTKTYLKEIVEKLAKDPKELSDLYSLIKANTPTDPLLTYGLSLNDFDTLLTKYSDVAEVKSLIDAIMGNESYDEYAPSAKNLSCEQIIEIHKFMNVELRNVVDSAKSFAATGEPINARFLTMAGQAIVGAKVLVQFGVESSEVEAAMMLNYVKLQYDSDFLKISVEMQAHIAELMAVND